MRKKLYIIPIVIFMLLSTTACEDYLDVNKNTDAPDRVDGYLYLAGILQSYQGMYWDLRAIAPITQMMGTTAAQFNIFADHYYPLGRDEGGEVWRTVYWLQGMNLENLINQSVAAEDWTLAGIGYAIKAYSWDQMTKIHGDLPMTDAFVPGLLSHDYDYQKEIYPQVREWAYKAIEYLEMDDPHNYGTKISANDLLYGGDKSKWIKFSYGVIARNLASLSNKANFNADYAQELIDAAGKSFQSSADDAALKVAGGSADAPYSAFNNFWGTNRGNLSRSYFQHDYAVQVFTGTVPKYDEVTGEKVPAALGKYPYELADKQIITDTLVEQTGHFDPRVAVKLSTIDNPNYENIGLADNVKEYVYHGGSFTSTTGPIGTAPSFYGRNATSSITTDGKGKWLYHDDAPYILMTFAEIKFCVAEAYWKLGNPAAALDAFKEAVKADLEFTGKYISPGTSGEALGGDKITTGVYQALANEYAAGPYVDGMTLADFSLSHIMMQKWVALYPWGAQEAWVDMRKYHYDVTYTGEYPSTGNGWDVTSLNQKWDTDPSKVYKGLYLKPAQVASRKGSYNINNNGSPSYRLRPRYNSEYMWNKGSLTSLLPISGTADNYQCSIPWFAYPNDLPTSN